RRRRARLRPGPGRRRRPDARRARPARRIRHGRTDRRTTALPFACRVAEIAETRDRRERRALSRPAPGAPASQCRTVSRWESEMNEKEGREAMEGNPTLQNPQAQQQQQTEVVVDDSATLPSYSNFCRVTATPEEVILDFGLNPQPFATGRQEVKANQRIVMNFYTAKRLLTALS